MFPFLNCFVPFISEMPWLLLLVGEFLISNQNAIGVAHTKYKNCGHKKSLTPEQATQVVDFVKHWRAKVFCICRHVRAESRLKVSLTTISRTLNRHISFVVFRHLVL